MQWSEQVIAALCEMKRNGVQDFGTAWVLALEVHRPRGRDVGEARPRLFADFGVESFDAPDEPLVSFTRRACEDAWNGRRDVLRYLSLETVA